VKPAVIGTAITIAMVLTWIFGIILLGSNAVMGILVIILAIALTYASSVWKRELRRQEMVNDILNDIKDQEAGD